MNKHRLRLFGFAACLCNCIAPAFADGPLDPDFAGGAVYAFPIATSSAMPLSITSDAAGRIITAGYSVPYSKPSAITVTRHSISPVGLDNHFANGGIATSPFGDAASEATAVAVDHAGRIVTVGYVSLDLPCGDSSGVDFYAVARFHGEDAPADAGKPDASFGGPWSGGTGVLVGDCILNNTRASGLAIDSNNYITAVGTAWDNEHRQLIIGLLRWTNTGTTDNTFGSVGIVTTGFEDSNTFGKAVVLDPYGRTLVAATTWSTSNGPVGLVLRYTANGMLDPTFGVGGIASTLVGANLCCISLDSEGRAVVAGDYEESGMFVARFTQWGTLDSTFGAGGQSKSLESKLLSSSSGLTLDKRGRAIVVGYSGDTADSTEVTLVHLNLDGTVNTAVGFEGIYKTAFGLGSSAATAVMVDSSNRPVVAIYGYDRDGYVPGLIRYDELFGDGFD